MTCLIAPECILSVLLIGALLEFVMPKNRNGIPTTVFSILAFIAASYGAKLAILDGEAVDTLTVLFNVEGLGALTGWLVLLLGALAMIASLSYMSEEEQSLQREYYVFSALFIASMYGMAVAADLLTLYIFLEIVTVVSTVLVIHDRRPESIEAGLKYLVLCSIGASVLLISAVLLLSQQTTLRFTDLAEFFLENKETLDMGFVNMCFVAFFLGLGVKAGIVPVHFWLPDALAEAPAPISALLSGAMIQVATCAMIRSVLAMRPVITAEMVQIMIVVGIITILLGALLALVQTDIKRLLAYSSIDEIGYIVLGLGLGTGTTVGLYGAVFHIINHALVKGMLFLISAALIVTVHERDMRKLGGLVKVIPGTAFAFMVGALSLGGVPPLNAFYSKFLIYKAAFDAGYPAITWLAVIASFIALGYYLRAGHMIFFGELKVHSNPEVKKTPLSIAFAVGVLCTLSILIGIFPQYVLQIVEKALGGLIK